jgi:hypothetical protein
LLPWTLWARWQPRNLNVHIFMVLVHGQATSARTPLNSTVKHYKLAI